MIWVAMLVCAVVVLFFSVKRKDRVAELTHSAKPLRQSGKCFRAIVGESHFQPALQKIAKASRVSIEGRLCDALLVPDPKNPVDPNAVGVWIDGMQVGYLSAMEAVQYRGNLKRAGLPLDVYRVGASLAGGGRKLYGVWIDLPDRLSN
jgi:hypothetical protein